MVSQNHILVSIFFVHFSGQVHEHLLMERFVVEEVAGPPLVNSNFTGILEELSKIMCDFLGPHFCCGDSLAASSVSIFLRLAWEVFFIWGYSHFSFVSLQYAWPTKLFYLKVS